MVVFRFGNSEAIGCRMMLFVDMLDRGCERERSQGDFKVIVLNNGQSGSIMQWYREDCEEQVLGQECQEIILDFLV